MATPLARGFQFSGQARNRLSYGQVKRLAESYGLPGDAMAQIARGESGLHADVQQRDPGDRMVGYGLLQMTPNAWGKGSAAHKYMESLGGIEAMRDPAKNMAMARFLYKAAGNKLTPWYGTRYLTNRSGEGTLKPVQRDRIPATTGGGSAGGGGGSTRTVTETTPGTDNRVARLNLVQSFLEDAKADPVTFALQARSLRDIPGTTTTSTTRSGAAEPDDAGGGMARDSPLAVQAKQRADVINAQQLPYKWGGGHAGQTKLHDAVPLDCSGAVSKVLGIDPRVSGQFQKWGRPGDGGTKGVTVYANGHHVLMKINGHFFGTSGSNPGGGAGWIPTGQMSPDYLRGFTARHSAK